MVTPLAYGESSFKPGRSAGSPASRPVPEAMVQASLKTAHDLRTVAQLTQLSIPDLQRLTLPELEGVIEQVARLVPAGNIPGMILSGLARLSERRPAPKVIRRDLNMLFKGVEQTLDAAVYTTFFAGPAAVIGAYQHLLKLAGKDPAEAFPEGTWQFYVEYAMREDTARHANETHGFDSVLRRQKLDLSEVDRLTSWVMAAIYCLHQYDALLANEWRERVWTRLLAEITGQQAHAAHFARLYQAWEKQRPYGRNLDSRQSYPAYRSQRFTEFLEERLADLEPSLRAEWDQLSQAESKDLPAYQQQLSILATLDPGPYGETRTPIPLAQACIGLIYQGRYALIPACLPGSERPADVQTIRAMVAAVLAQTDKPEELDSAPCLAQIKRAAWPGLRQKLSQELRQDLERLRLAPILINSDRRPRRLPLAELRQAERGLGDHALTLFDTGETMVFDQSHIFFDGAWGAALAEIMTQEAIYWANSLYTAPLDVALAPRPPQLLRLNFPPAELAALQQAPHVAAEVSAETDRIDLKAMLSLRRLFKKRSDKLRLTVNDLLILYRAIHALTYQPEPALVAELETLLAAPATRPAALAALDSAVQANPTIVIPVDAGQVAPRNRLYPITFEAPLLELDFLGLHQRTLAAWQVYRQASGDRSAAYAEFDRCQRDYLATLAGLGQLLDRTKHIARSGESLSTGALKLLANFPAPVQRLLEKVPDSFDLLNDLLKGREVFSNVGMVAPISTLTRFSSAKDDNDKKTLVWGVITDAQGVMRLSLRDFRPHVGLLVACGQRDLAARLTQHYLDAYARGLNKFMRELREITWSSREAEPSYDSTNP
jgi:hypothetical protein